MRPINQREKYFAAIVAALLLVWGAVCLIAQPLWREKEEVSRSIRGQQKQMAESRQTIAKEKKFLPRYQFYWNAFKQKGTDEETISVFVSEIEKAANQIDLRIMELKPQKKETRGLVSVYSLNLSFESDYLKLLKFLDLLQQNPNFFDIEDCSITKKANKSSPELQIDIKLSRIFIP
ncbi:MAG: hypothetical protein HQL23_08170 [Candidatus Omnitrophica bacterium]|nr:hypothetical protein [Candidatus Omnitrophota bacterium]